MRPGPTLRHFLTLALALSVALTAVHTAVGRAEARGARAVVICSDGSAVTIQMDATGTPVEVHHTCPDCVLGGLAVAAVPVMAVAPVLARRRSAAPVRGRAVAGRARPPETARGPPVAA